MRLEIKKLEFLKVLNIASDAIPSKSNEASFLNFLLSVDETGLNVLASDGNIYIKVHQDIKNEKGEEVISSLENGSIQLPAKLVREIVSKLVGDTVTLEEVDSNLFTVSDNRTTFNINCKEGEEYPDVEVTSNIQHEIQIKFDDFLSLYNSTYFAVAIKTNRPLFTGISVKCNNKKISFSASDTCRIARKSVNLDSDSMMSFNCPLKVMSVIAKHEPVENLVIKTGLDKVVFVLGNTTIGARTIGGEFPDVDKIIPPKYIAELEINSNDFVEALDRVCIVSSDDKTLSKNVKLYFDGDKVQISSRSTSYGTSSEVLDNCSFKANGPFTICFNSVFVSQACKAIEDENIKILFSGEVRMFRVLGNDEANLQLITPVRYYFE